LLFMQEAPGSSERNINDKYSHKQKRTDESPA
jgi:hypothetical protein